ncbi:hypothetical protein NY486_01870, partial [Enterobacter hormaechei]|nr:hypothetical protein [Enterobacter hormaechei]
NPETKVNLPHYDQNPVMPVGFERSLHRRNASGCSIRSLPVPIALKRRKQNKCSRRTETASPYTG